MTYLADLPDPRQPLPHVPGPKPSPFTPTAHAEIEFIEELGDPDNDKDGRVWKVLIDEDGPYALKMVCDSWTRWSGVLHVPSPTLPYAADADSMSTFQFHLIHSEFLSYTLAGGLNRSLASSQYYVDFFDPFNCECRAYGRLQEEKREDVAVRAHGYLLLTPAQEAEITSKGWGEPYRPDDDEVELNSTKPWQRSEQHRHLPIRCIVKDLATGPEPFTPMQISTLWCDLEDFHKVGSSSRTSGSATISGANSLTSVVLGPRLTRPSCSSKRIK